MGFGPQLVDLDSDGRTDVISGDWPGRVILFRRQADGQFAAGEPVKDRDGEEIKMGLGVSAFAADWDADGDLDLIAGIVETGKNNVFLIRNEGTPENHAYAKPQPLKADDGKVIVAAGGDAAPIPADWDGDGKLDLLLGTSDGSVVWYRNVGTRRDPRLKASGTLIPAPDPKDDRGTRSKLCVTDWNADGRLDLLVGDFGKEFDKELSNEEKRWRDRARARQDDLLKTWAKVFREYRRLLGTTEPQEPEAKRHRAAKLADLRKQMKELKTARESSFREEQALKPGKQYHGRVWVFLRAAPRRD